MVVVIIIDLFSVFSK